MNYPREKNDQDDLKRKNSNNFKKIQERIINIINAEEH